MPGRVIRHSLKSDWKFHSDDVSINHIGREWYIVEFFYEEDIEYVLKNGPWFVQEHIAMKRWSLELSSFHATVDSIVNWVRIPFLPLHYRDEDVLRDLVSIFGTLLQVDEESLIGRHGMFV